MKHHTNCDPCHANSQGRKLYDGDHGVLQYLFNCGVPRRSRRLIAEVGTGTRLMRGTRDMVVSLERTR
jgi:hypothetical protein